MTITLSLLGVRCDITMYIQYRLHELRVNIFETSEIFGLDLQWVECFGHGLCGRMGYSWRNLIPQTGFRYARRNPIPLKRGIRSQVEGEDGRGGVGRR